MRYTKGYKYQLYNDDEVYLTFAPLQDISSDFIRFNSAGRLLMKKGYAWDGPSGPTIDTKNFMRGSLIHDALYQLMRQGYLPLTYRGRADLALKKLILEAGMSKVRAWWVYHSLRVAGRRAALPINKKVILEV